MGNLIQTLIRILFLSLLILGNFGNCKKDKEDKLLYFVSGFVAGQSSTKPSDIGTSTETGTGGGTSTFSIGGTITGLTAAGLVLQNNTADDLTVASGATSFTFATKVSGAYAVTVKTQPTGLFCTVTSGTGTATANVSNVTLACVAQITKDWGTFTDMNNGTVRLVVNPGTYGGQTYTAQTLFYAKCSHGQTYNAGGNTCTGTATLIQFCTSGGNSCNGNDANLPVSSGPLFNACNGLSLASKTWRVPTKNELKLLIECTDTKLPNDLSICGGAPDPSINNLFPVTATPFIGVLLRTRLVQRKRGSSFSPMVT